MSLFKKLFGKPENNPVDKGPIRITRAVRIPLRPMHRIAYRLKGEMALQNLANISVRGMAIIHRDDKRWSTGRDFSGLIKIDRREFAIETRVRYLGEVLAGCEFLGENPELKREIESYLRIEILALNLRPVHPAFLKGDSRGEIHWLTDGGQNEIYCVMDSSGLVAFHLNFFGRYVEGERDSGLRAGEVREDAAETPKHKGSAMLDLAREASPETYRLAVLFAESAERLPEPVRTALLGFLSQSG